MSNRNEVLKDIKRDWQLYLFLLLPLAYIIIFAYIPMAGLQIAFREFNARLGMTDSAWVGFEQFYEFFNSFYFTRLIKNTLILSAYSILCSFPFPIIMALLMNCLRSRHIKNLCQTIVTLPHFISVVVLVGMMFQFFNSRNGIYGNLYHAIYGLFPADPFASPTLFRHFFIWSGVWQNYGWNSILYLAALAGVDPALHEAATIDGASRFQRVLHVDFPTILPTVVIMLIMRTGSVMTIGFEKVFLMQNSANLETSEVISTYVYKVGLASSGTTDFSYSTAIGLFNSIINLILISVVNKISDKLSGNSMW